jgi:hypothetical protein
MRRIVTLVAALTLLGACGLGQSDPLHDSTVPVEGTVITAVSDTTVPPATNEPGITTDTLAEDDDTEAPPELRVAPCSGDCFPALQVGEVTYLVECLWLRPELVTDQVAAEAEPGAGFGNAYVVLGYPLILAIAATRNWCGAAMGGFIALFGPGDGSLTEMENATAFQRTRCEAFVTVPEVCAQGGEARAQRWDATTGTHHTEYAYFPEVVDEIDRSLRAGTGPRWRMDPDAVIEDWWEREELTVLCGEERDWQYACRVGTRWISDTELRVRFLQLTEVNSPPEPNFEGADYVVSLAQLGGGPSWWVTGYEERSLVGAYEAVGEDVALEAWDSYWEGCCDEVWIELGQYG